MDFGNIEFNPNHKIEAAARQASEGIRFLLIGLGASALSFGVAVLELGGIIPGGLAMVALIALWFVSLVGVYGAYLAASAVGWPGAAIVLVVVGAIVPYVKFIVFLVLLGMSIGLIQRAGFSVSFFGPLQKARRNA